MPKININLYKKIINDAITLFEIYPLTYNNVISYYANNYINNTQNKKLASKKMLHFIYKAYQNNESIFKEIKDENFNLKNFPVLINDGTLKPIKSCYLESKDGEQDLFNNCIKTSYYFSKDDDEKIWEQLFIEGNVQKDEISISVIEEKQSYSEIKDILDNGSEETLKLLRKYVMYIFDKEPESKMNTSKRKDQVDNAIDSGWISFRGFHRCDSLLNLTIDENLRLRWFIRVFKKNWESIKRKSTIVRKTSKSCLTIETNEHFIIYYFKNKIQLQSNEQPDLSINLFYNAKLVELSKSYTLPIALAQLPEPINDEQAELLGFRQQLTPEEILKLLATLTDKSSINEKASDKYINQLKSIYSIIVNSKSTPDTASLNSWKKERLFLASNKTFQPIDELTLPMTGDMSITSSHCLFSGGLSSSKVEKLGRFFVLKPFDKNTIETIYNETDEAEDEIRQLKKSLYSLLVIASWIDFNTEHTNIDEYVTFFSKRKIKQNFDKIIFHSCISIEIEKDRKNNYVYMHDDELFFSGRIEIAINQIAKIIASYFLKSTSAQSLLENQLSNLFDEKLTITDIFDSRQITKKPKRLLKELINNRNHDQQKTIEESIEGITTDLDKLALCGDPSDKGSGEEDDPLILKTPPKREKMDKKSFKKRNKQQNTPNTPIFPRKPQTGKETSQQSTNKIITALTPKAGNITLPDELPKTPKRTSTPLGNKDSTSNKKSSSGKKTPGSTDKKNAVNKTDDVERKHTGNEGEKIVFQYIKSLMKKQIDSNPIDALVKIPGTPDTIKPSPAVCFKKGDKDIKLLFFNKTKIEQNLTDTDELEGPADLAILLNDELHYVIEVKSTQSLSENTFFISPNEWQKMIEGKDKYVLIRVYGALSEAPKVYAYKNPWEMITKGYITMAYSFFNEQGSAFEFNFHGKEDEINQYRMKGKSDDAIGCKIS